MNSYIHRRRGVSIGSPAIIWHRAYWKPSGENDADWLLAIDKYLRITRRKFSRIISRVAPHQKPDPRRARRTSKQKLYDEQFGREYIIHGELGQLKIAIIPEQFSEFWSVKTIIDFCNIESIDSMSSLPREVVNLYEYLVRIENMMADRLSHITDDNEKERINRELADRYVRFISFRMSEILTALHGMIFPKGCIDFRDVICNSSADLFANFIGFSLAIPPDVTASTKRATRSKAASGIGEVVPSSTPGYLPPPRGKPQSVKSSIMPGATFPDESPRLLDFVEAIWPVAAELNPYIRYGHVGLNGIENFEAPKREFTVSLLSRNRALFISSLGGVRKMENKELYFPLSYLLVCPHRASWQIGRLIDRIHTLGVFRLAAFMEYEEVEKSNDDMRKLIDQLNGGDDVQVVSSKFRSICNSVENGLNYRIEWSRFYVGLYEKCINFLNFGEVEGYQTYAEFTNKTLSRNFETLSIVRRRFDYLSNLIHQHVNRQLSNSTKGLLEFAEIVSPVPIAYYSFHVIENINHALVRLIGVRVPFLTAEDAWLIVAVGYGVLIWVAKPLWRFIKARQRRHISELIL